MVAGGAEAAICRIGIAGFTACKALSTDFNDTPTKASRPWDKDRDGFVMGEGAGVVVLEEYEHAKKRGAKIYAEVIGYGLSGDAYHITAPAEDGDGAIPRDAGGAEARRAQRPTRSTTSTPTAPRRHGRRDRARRGEARCSATPPTSCRCRRPSRRSAICWARPARSRRSSAIKAIRDQVVPPTLNLDDPAEGCDIDLVPQAGQAAQGPLRAARNSFGFGGTNASLIFGRRLSRRGLTAVLSYFRWVLFFVVLFATVMGGALFLGQHSCSTRRAAGQAAKNVVIPRGAGPVDHGQGAAARRASSRHPRLFRIALMIDPTPQADQGRRVRGPGAHHACAALVELLQSGKRGAAPPHRAGRHDDVRRSLELVRKTEALTGEVTLDVKEGDLLPETYFYSRDDTRDSAAAAHEGGDGEDPGRGLAQARAGLPLANRREALMLASIVEKETGACRPSAPGSPRSSSTACGSRMKLESDPTDDLRPHRRQGRRSAASSRAPTCSRPRPTTPTSSPACRRGRSAIPAAPRSWPRLNPRRATAPSTSSPTGRAATPSPLTLAEHNRNVARWREIQRERQEAGSRRHAGQPAPPAPLHPLAARGAGTRPAVSHAGDLLLALVVLAVVAFGVAWFLRANPSSHGRLSAVDPGRRWASSASADSDLRRAGSCPACCPNCWAWPAS